MLVEERGWKRDDINLILSLKNPLDLLLFDETRRCDKELKRGYLVKVAIDNKATEDMARRSMERICSPYVEGCRPLVEKSEGCNGVYKNKFRKKVMKVFGKEDIPNESSNEKSYKTEVNALRIYWIKKGIRNFSLWEFILD